MDLEQIHTEKARKRSLLSNALQLQTSAGSMKLTGSVLLNWENYCCICLWVQVISHINDANYHFSVLDTLLHPNNINNSTDCLLLLYSIEIKELADENTTYNLEKKI